MMTGSIVATLAGGLVADLSLGFDHGHAAQRGPLGAVGQPVEFAGAKIAAGLPLFVWDEK